MDRKKVITILLRHKSVTLGDKSYDGIQFTMEDIANLLTEQEETIKKLKHCRLCRKYSCDGCKYR